MSIVRTVIASAVAATALVAASGTAHAFKPIQGHTQFGPSYSKSVSKGDFGAGFQVYGRAYGNDYDKICSTTKPEYQCQGSAPFMAGICKSVFTAVSNQVCQKHGVGFGAEGKASADLTLFGKDFDLFDIGAAARAEPEAATAEYGVSILGAKIVGESRTAGFTKSVPLGERTLASASSTFMLGPVPIKVEASAVGSLGIDFGLTLGTAQATGNVTPWAAVDGVFSAGLGTKGLSAGLEGDLLLVKLSTPATATIAWQGGKTFGYDAGLDLVINSLDGSISLYGECGPYKKSWEIFSWEGLSYTKNLGSVQGTFSL